MMTRLEHWFEDWMDDEMLPFDDRLRPEGFRIRVNRDGPQIGDESKALHWSGGELLGSCREARCPNCATPMFPLFKLNFLADSRLRELGLWMGDTLQLLRCFVCGLELEPYWTFFGTDSIEIVGGYRARPPYLIEGTLLPYPIRPVELEELGEEDYPVTEQTLKALQKRRPPEVYHQIGGLPYRGTHMYKPLNCAKCGAPMLFAGVIDDDDRNVYCYDLQGVYCTLTIGDRDSLYFYTCKRCMGVGFKWVH